MCLGVPGRVIELLEVETDRLPMALVAFGGATKPICIALVPGVRRGDHVLVHAGLALETIDEAHADELLEHLKSMSDAELAEITTPGGPGGGDEAPR